jgi:1,4-dihydroxy-2-naphthoate octaprenyltransferase
MARGGNKSTKLKDARPIFPRLIIATRPWSFPAALSPLFITFAILWLDSNLNFVHGALFAIGITALQAAANLLNSFCDFRNGLDREETAGDRTLVDELVTKKEFPFLFLSVVAIWFVSFVSTLPFSSSIFTRYLAVYVAGLSLSVLYSAGSPPLKYIGFGDVAVFLSFGPLLVVAGAWACAADPTTVDLRRIVVSTIPAAILVVAILHANNHRDMKVDAINSAKTVSVRLGAKLSKRYYDFLVLSPSFLAAAIAVSLPRSVGLVGGVLVLPLGLRVSRLMSSDTIPRDIDAETAKIMLLFGLLESVGLLVVGA